MAAVVNRSYLQAAQNLATDLARYGASAEWSGVYYRGEKIGFTVSQTIPKDDGFELQEDGQLLMALLGSTTATTIRTTARVDRAFALRSFEFSLDPGTGPTTIKGDVRGNVIDVSIVSAAGTRTQQFTLSEPPLLSLNFPRRLASAGLAPGRTYDWAVFDPATLTNAPMHIEVGKRELVRTGTTSVPAFRIETQFQEYRTTSWMTDTGEVVREESPMGLITMRESPESAKATAISGRVRADLLAAAAVVPDSRQPIAEPRDVRRMRLRLEGADLSHADLDGGWQHAAGNVVELTDPQQLTAGPRDPDLEKYLRPEAFIESDDPAIQAEANLALRDVKGARARAEALTRYVNHLLEKKPTVSLPSAREVLRTRVGDCNEHTVLYVAMARAGGLPARIDVGLTLVRGAFYYHAWPEVYIEEGRGGYWLPVDPTLNEFPADTTHLRIARGGLDKQAAILPLIGQLKITVVDLEMDPGTPQVLIGRDDARRFSDAGVAAAAAPRSRKPWCLPCFLGGGR